MFPRPRRARHSKSQLAGPSTAKGVLVFKGSTPPHPPSSHTRALQHYLGHKNIQQTVRYTEMAPDRFKDFWRG